MHLQQDFFGPAAPVPGLRYVTEAIGKQHADALVAGLKGLSFEPFKFQGYVGNRRVVSYGWSYDFGSRQLLRTSRPPEFLQPLIERAAQLLAVSTDRIEHVLVSEYAPGAGIGWHRDKAVFDEIVAFSFLATCRIRFRLRDGLTWRRHGLEVASGSAYILSGPARRQWEHSIAPVNALRYSVTMRTLA